MRILSDFDFKKLEKELEHARKQTDKIEFIKF